MKQSTHIRYRKNLIASIYYQIPTVSKSTFFTHAASSLQVGIQTRKKNSQIKSHIHPPLKPVIHNTYEVLYVVRGEMTTTFINDKGEVLKRMSVKAGDLIIQYQGGHSFEFVKKTILFEVKPGPYTGGHITINEKQNNPGK